MLDGVFEIARSVEENDLEHVKRFVEKGKLISEKSQHARVALGALALSKKNTEARNVLKQGIVELGQGSARLESQEDFQGIELLPGCARQFTRRTQKARGYSVALWIHSQEMGRFELFSLGGGALRVEIDASEERWRIEVFAKGRLRGSGSCPRRRIWQKRKKNEKRSELADEHSFDGTLIVATQGAKYLSQAQVIVYIKDGPQLVMSSHTFSAAMPAMEESEEVFTSSSSPLKHSASQQLRPPALRLLRGFSGSCRSIAVFEGVVPAQGVERLWIEDWSSILAETPPPRDAPGEKQLSLQAKAYRNHPEVIPKIIMAAIPRSHQFSLWLPRSSSSSTTKDNEFSDPSTLIVPRLHTDRIVLNNAIFFSGSLYRHALAAAGGIAIAVGAGADCDMIASLLLSCGRSQAEDALQSRALFALAAKADWTAKQALALIDAASCLAGPGSIVHAAALEAFFGHAAASRHTTACDHAELLRGAAERAAPALLCDPSTIQGREDDGLASALKDGVGIDRIIALAKGPITNRAESNFEQIAVALDSLRLCAAVIIYDELRSDASDEHESEEEAALIVAGEPTPVLTHLIALIDAIQATGGATMRCIFLEALALATSRAHPRRRAAVASLLQRVGFAERITPRLLHMAEQDFPPLPRNCHLYFPVEATATLASSAVRLALWQHHSTDTALRAAVSASCAKFSVSEGGETASQRRLINEKLTARRTFRRYAARAATALAAELDASITRNSNEIHAATIAAKALLGSLVDNDDTENSEEAMSQTNSHPLARSLPGPPLWLALPFLAVLCPRLGPSAAEQYVAAACAKLKSQRTTLEALTDLGSLEYALKSLLELAWRCRDSLIELLTLDAIAALLLTRSPTNNYELDHTALARLSDPKLSLWTGSTSKGELWQKRAVAAVATSLSRRLAADVAANEASAAACLATVLDVVLDKLLPPVPKAALKRSMPLVPCALGSERGADLARAVSDAARALRRVTDSRRRGAKEEDENKQSQPRLSLFQLGRKSVAEAARRRLSEIADLSTEERGSHTFGETRSSRSSAAATVHPVLSSAATNSLLALRRCGRTLARAIAARLHDDPAALAQLVIELRACVALGIDVADDVVTAGNPSAAVVACDDTLHALACLAAELNFSRPDTEESKEMRRVVDTAVLGLIRDSLHQAGGGVATACARAALHPAAHVTNAREALSTLTPQLESALAQDEDDAEAYVSADQPFRRYVSHENEESHALALYNSSEAVLHDSAAKQRKASAARRNDRLVASSAALYATLARDARVELNIEPENEGQRLWELNDGNALTVPSLVAAYSEVIDEPLKPHDEDVDSPSSLLAPTKLNHDKLTASLVVVGVAPLPASTQDDEVEEVTAAGVSRPKDSVDEDRALSDAAAATDTEEPPRGALLRSFNRSDDADDQQSRAESPQTATSQMPPKSSASPPRPQRVISKGGITDISDNTHGVDSSNDIPSLGPTDGPFPRGGTAEAYVLRRLTRIQRQGVVGGTLCITRSRKWLVFRPDNNSKNSAWRFRDISLVLTRRYRLRDTALELYFRRGPSLFIDCVPSSSLDDQKTTKKDAFGVSSIDEFTDDEDDEVDDEDEDDEETLHIRGKRRRDDLLKNVVTATRNASPRFPTRLDFLPLLQSSSRSHPSRLLRRVTRAWQDRRLSNYEYLLFLNALGGRSFADPCSYPVFPWILANYTSETLDIDDPDNYRDLSKPMGALNEARLRDTVARYETFVDPHVPPFHYGSHYSTSAGVVMHYLLRLTSFAKLHCELQGGKFDVADRLFASIPEAWSANSGARGASSGGEVKEVTPEWYSTPAFLVNRGNLPLGASQEGDAIGDVELPPWARGSPHAFIAANRAALESDIVSNSLHGWIDLVFGFKQRGQAAVDSHNVFFYLCYADAIDLDQIDDKKLRASTVLQASQFGQVPTQLLSKAPHPIRGAPAARFASPRPLLMTDSRSSLPDLGLEVGTSDFPLAFARSAVIGLADDVFLSSSPMSTGETSFAQHGDDSLALVSSISCVALAAFEAQSALDPNSPRSASPKARPLVALRATAGRALGVDDEGQICVFAWGYEKAEENIDGESVDISLSGAIPPPESNEEIRRAVLRPLPLNPTLDEFLTPVPLEPLALRKEALSPRMVSISADCRFIAAVDPNCTGCVRLMEVAVSEAAGRESAERLERLCTVVQGEASVPAAQCALSLVTFAERDADEWDEDEDRRPYGLMLIVGVVNGTASIWRIDRAQDLPRLGQRVLKRKSIVGRRPELIARGHSAPVVAADVSTALGVLLTAAADGAVLLHDLNGPRAGTLIRRIRPPELEPERNSIVRLALGRRRGILALVTTDGKSIEVLSLNGGPLITGSCLKSTPLAIRFAGENDAGLFVLSAAGVELRSVDRGLAVITRLSSADLLLPQALATPGRSLSSLCAAELAPDACRPAALIVATADATIALRVLAGSEDWYERKASQEASVGAALAKTATNVIGLVAGAAAKTHEIAAVTRGVVQEAASTSSFRAITKFLSASSNSSSAGNGAAGSP